MNDTIRNSKPITWQDIEPLIFDPKYKDFFKNLDPKTFELVLDEKNHSKVLESVLKMLTVTDPENANREFASQIIKMMRKISGQLTKGDTYRSYLMGASQITDKELLKLNIQIDHCTDSESRKLIIPSTSIENYKDLVRKQLDNGFWNDFVGDDLIYFIFKMPDGAIKEFVYSEEVRLEIAALCSQLNHDPIEETSDLLNYMAENEFYAEAVEKFKSRLEIIS